MEADTRTALFSTGVRHFNAGEYFEAHEVWEEVWHDCPSAERRFFQALIQAAVAVYHWNRGNTAGAVRLFHSGRRYMEPYRPVYRGLDVDRFWKAVESHIAPALAGRPGPCGPAPVIELVPEPGQS